MIPPQARPSQKLYTKTFWMLCLSYAFLGGSFNMIIPELPSFLSQLGGAEYKGFIIALFTLTAGFSRPFSGKLADSIGRRPIIIVGTLVCILCSLLYPILTTISGFMLLRLAHGFSTGFSPTAITAYVADIVPIHRRGEAMGIIGISINLGSSVTPPIGSYLAGAFSTTAMFYASSLCGLISMLLILGIKETIDNKQKFHPRMLKLKRNEIINRRSIFPAIVCGLAYMGFGAVITVSPDQCEFMGMSNKGLYFTSFTLCSVLSRFVAGRLSDKYGRLVIMRIAIVLLSMAYILFGMAESPTWLLSAAGLLGFSLGIAMPVVFAWTIDRSEDSNRGKALATVFIGLEGAIGFGALLGAHIYNNTPANFDITFWVMGGITLLALFFIREERNLIANKATI